MANAGVIYNMLCEFEFQFLGAPMWVKADVDTTEILTAMRSGMLRGNKLAAVRLFSVDTEEQSDTFVYNFKPGLGESAWSLDTVSKPAPAESEHD